MENVVLIVAILIRNKNLPYIAFYFYFCKLVHCTNYLHPPYPSTIFQLPTGKVQGLMRGRGRGI